MSIKQIFKGSKMAPLKIHNGGSYALMEYLTCWKYATFNAVTSSCYIYNNSPHYLVS